MGQALKNGRRLAAMVALAVAGAVVITSGCGTQTAATGTMSVAGPEATPTDSPAVATSTVAIQNYAFSPQVVTVPVGTEVTWTNGDIAEHTVTARDKSFDSGAVENTKSFRFRFTRAGSYRYFCALHPYMVGTVVVTAQ